MFCPLLRAFVTIVFVVLILGVTGCATNQKLVQLNDIAIETIDSKSTVITHAYLSVSNNAIALHGELTRRISMRGPIPGHLHIELINPKNEVIKKADIGYKRKNRQSQHSQFNLELPQSIVAGSIIRITHHDLLSHLSEPPRSPWENITPDNHEH